MTVLLITSAEATSAQVKHFMQVDTNFGSPPNNRHPGINGDYRLVTELGLSDWTGLYVKDPNYWLQTNVGQTWKIATFSTQKYDAKALSRLRAIFSTNEIGHSVGVVAKSLPGRSDRCQIVPIVNRDHLRKWQDKLIGTTAATCDVTPKTT